ncbi:MAG: family 20 glycosylhydrolase, partial [Muribaculaceae bacterium]|nr:family 20 glycosylhydrolase [Muribaculaceae bacterium]
VYWSSENLPPDSGKRTYRETITVKGDLRGVRRLAYNKLGRHIRMVDPADTLIELFTGYYAIGSPKFAEATGNDSVTFEVISSGHLSALARTPDGPHLVMNDGTVVEAHINRKDFLDNPDSYGFGGVSAMPSGHEIFEINEEIHSRDTACVYDVVPSFKSVALTGGVSDVDFSDIEYGELPSEGCYKPETYRILIGEGKVRVEAPRRQWRQIGMRIAHNFGTGTRLMPDAVIVDYPDYEYRGLMVDIARNYQEPSEIHRLLDLMAVYGFNTFHFHLVDDEAWRLEIKSLPELTEVGAFRGYTTADGNEPFLPRVYGGCQNGYFTQDDYISVLRHADSLNIDVIPEIESPGHARAA